MTSFNRDRGGHGHALIVHNAGLLYFVAVGSTRLRPVCYIFFSINHNHWYSQSTCCSSGYVQGGNRVWMWLLESIVSLIYQISSWVLSCLIIASAG